MQKNALVAGAAFMALCVCSCKKNSPVIISKPVVYDNYTQLKTGNYWIYQVYNVDSMGNGPALNQFDSTYVRADTVIHGNTYYQVVSTTPPYNYDIWLRDSLHYLVNQYGKIQFSAQDFTNTFTSGPFLFDPQQGDTIAWFTQKMADKNALFNTPAGTFVTSDFQTIYDMYPGHNQAGTHRVIHKRFAGNVGVVSETIPFYALSPGYKEKRLVRFHLN